MRTGMVHQENRSFPRLWLKATTLGLLGALIAGCSGSDGLSPAPETPLAGTPVDTSVVADSTLAAPVDSTLGVPTDSASAAGIGSGLAAVSALPGIVFGTFGMKTELFGSVHNGSQRAPGPGNIIELLSGARAKGGRIVMQMTGGQVSDVKNADGTFNLTKWKAKVAEFRYVAFGSFITDGTVLVHYMIDEPNNPSKWGGKIIPQATVEAMAKYSKSIWPGMTTVARVVPSWLANAPVTYTYLDAAWAQYRSSKGDVNKFLAAEVAAAKTKGLGVIVGLNLLNGGNGSSGIRGTKSGEWSMSANELKTYGTALLNNTYSCGFMMWQYNYTYYGRSDIKLAMAGLSTKAQAHVKTSCRQ